MVDLGNTAGLVLAAGSGQRFGGPKAPFVFEGERLVDRGVRILREAGIINVFVVLGAWVGEVPQATVIENPDFMSGMASSLRTGLVFLSTEEPQLERVAITLVDHIGLSAEAITKITSEQGGLIQSTYEGKIAHPVVIGREHWATLINEVSGDMGAKNYLTRNNATRVELGELATNTDLDYRPV
jgi:CTP:molybdopterin cytidylyltransferase MocA